MNIADVKKIQIDRTNYNFNYRYAKLGGITKLRDMAEREHCTLNQIAHYFGISNQRVSQILNVLFDEPYSMYLLKKGVIHAPGRLPAPKTDLPRIRTAGRTFKMPKLPNEKL